MIVKILQDDGWVVYDGFAKVHYRHLTIEEARSSDADARWFGSKKDESKKESSCCILIIARRRVFGPNVVNVEFTILADDIVYLCNDEGKTIERIN